MMRLITTTLLALATLPLTAGAFELTPQQQANIKVTTTTVSERQVVKTLSVNGTIRAVQQRLYRVAPLVEGQVTELNVALYDKVRKGQLLAQLHSNALGQAEANYLEALAQDEVAQANYQRIKGLSQEGVVASSRLVEAESQYKTTQALLQQRRNTLILAGMKRQQIESLAQHPERIADYPLLSPSNGVLLEIAVENGQMVAAGQSAFRIADLGQVEALIRIPAGLIGQVNDGTKVTIASSAFPGEQFIGHLKALSGEVDAGSQTIAGRVLVENRRGKLRPGMYIQAELPGLRQSGLMVPESAVIRRGNDSYLLKVNGPRSYEPVKVEVTPAGSGWIRIDTGVAAGTPVVSGGAAELKAQWLYQGGE